VRVIHHHPEILADVDRFHAPGHAIDVRDAADGDVDVAVHHLDNAGRAAALAERLEVRVPGLGDLYVAEVTHTALSRSDRWHPGCHSLQKFARRG
jgi:hypothetical protein